MPVDSTHPEYDKALPSWTLVRDVLGGQRAVHEAGPRYLPMLSEQKPAEYAAYRARAQFIGAPERTHDTWVGYLFRKDPQYVFPTVLQDYMTDSTLGGLSFYDWLKDTVRAVMGVGRRGTLVDWDELLHRPFIAAYEAEQITNWKVERIGTMLALTRLVLYEQSTVYYGYGEGDAPVDDYDHKTYPQWRVYEVLLDTAGQPYVRCQLWRKRLTMGATAPTGPRRSRAQAIPGTGTATDPWLLVDETYPARRGVPLARIPFVFHGPNNFLPNVDKVPLEALAYISISHYRTSADLENGLHVTGLPTPWAKGFGGDNPVLPLGSNVAWSSNVDWAQCGFLEVTGGFDGLTKALKSKEDQMTALGARMFDRPTGTHAEAYDTVRIRQTGESVTLASVSTATTQSASKVLQWAAWWMSGAAAPEDLAKQASVELTTEFVQADIQPAELDSLKNAWVAKAISHQTVFHRLQEADFYPPDWTYEEEVDAITNDPLANLGNPDAAGGGAGGTAGGTTTGKAARGGGSGGGQGGQKGSAKTGQGAKSPAPTNQNAGGGG